MKSKYMKKCKKVEEEWKGEGPGPVNMEAMAQDMAELGIYPGEENE